MAVLDENQAFAAQYRYSPFGVLTNQSGTLDQPFQFSSKRYDPATGLNYYGYRFYSPNLGRWINRDPLGEAGGINLYGFVENDPVNWSDPMGLTAMEWAVPVSAIISQLDTPLPGPADAIAGALIGAALLYDTWPGMMNEGDDECIEPGPDHPYNPGQPSEKDGFKPPKNWNGQKTKKNGQWGWTDKNGNHWVPTNPGNAHGGPHWDVQKPGGGYVNVFPGGTVR